MPSKRGTYQFLEIPIFESLPETTEVRKNSNTSKNLRAGIIKRLSKENTSKEIAESFAVSTNTILRIQCDLSKTLERPKTLPDYMCFD